MTILPATSQVPHYLAVGFSKRRALAVILKGRMDACNAKGKGNRAARRQAFIELFAEAEALPLSEHEVDDLSESYRPMSGFTPQEDEDAAFSSRLEGS